MVDDKYIGLALAVSSSLAIGVSMIITKKGLNAAAGNSYGQSASDNYSYLSNPIWWAGMSSLILGEVCNFAAYTFAPPILVTPLGALSVLIGAVLASFLLGEELGHLGRVGCTLSLLGSLIIVLHAPDDKPVETVDEILAYAVHPGFMLYVLTVLVFSLIMIYSVVPRHGRTNPLVYISICSLVGSVSVMSVKGFGVAVKLTFGGKNQFLRPSTYVFGLVSALCIMVQMNYYNKALDTFSVNIVNPMLYVGFSSATIVASLILFQGFNTHDATNTFSLLCGFIVTFLGVHILNLSREQEPPLDHSSVGPLESGLFHPRLSLQGRMSADGWTPQSPRTPGGSRLNGHGRRSSAYRNQTSTLFSAFEGEEDGEPLESAMSLHQLREEDEEFDDNGDDATERTRLRSASGAEQHVGSHGRGQSQSHSRPPMMSSMRQGNGRIS